jgi:hypothetical protein
MARTDSWQPAVIALRVKSGWATAVLLAGPIDAPVVLDAGIVYLSDPKVPDSKQPYHDGMYVARKRGHNLSGFSRALPPTRNDLSQHFSASMSQQATACPKPVSSSGARAIQP